MPLLKLLLLFFGKTLSTEQAPLSLLLAVRVFVIVSNFLNFLYMPQHGSEGRLNEKYASSMEQIISDDTR